MWHFSWISGCSHKYMIYQSSVSVTVSEPAYIIVRVSKNVCVRIKGNTSRRTRVKSEYVISGLFFFSITSISNKSRAVSSVRTSCSLALICYNTIRPVETRGKYHLQQVIIQDVRMVDGVGSSFMGKKVDGRKEIDCAVEGFNRF